jgi:hypothetical protein
VSTEHPELVAALARLRVMAASASDPTLTDDELRMALAGNALRDSDGYRPDEPEWTPSYQLGAAAQDAWLVKAGKAASRVDGGEGGLKLTRSQLHAHCLAMADRYALRRTTSVPLSHTTGRDERLPVLNRYDDVGGMTTDPRTPAPGGASR